MVLRVLAVQGALSQPAELLDAAREFRRRGIPIDVIVKDWLYWGDLGWGPQWDPHIYPDPGGMVRELHADMNVRLVVSVWSKFGNGTEFRNVMTRNGWMLGGNGNGTDYYDAYDPEARKAFYGFSRDAHFDIGVDALWLDATEPEDYPNVDRRVGPSGKSESGNVRLNSYGLETSGAIADGLRRDFSHEGQGRRVLSLTRSSFSGQQRTGAALWTGDISGTWDVLRRQIVSSLNYQLSGMPYWAQDIGGFFRPDDQYDSPEYRALLTRWFQFGAFTPIFRQHGCSSDTELWNYGNDTMADIVQSSIRLRYRLLPYHYSGFWRVYREGWTMQRAMAFDFGVRDPRTRRISDQFMYGDAFLVAPMYSPGFHRLVYVPHVVGGWYNFYTGEKVEELGTDVAVRASMREIPLLVRAGSIVIMGPDLQYVSEKEPDPLEIRLYPGGAGGTTFVLHEDDGVNYVAPTSSAGGGLSSTDIKFAWDRRSELCIGERRGTTFPGMLAGCTFNVVVVGVDRGMGVAPGDDYDKIVKYVGEEMVVNLEPEEEQQVEEPRE